MSVLGRLGAAALLVVSLSAAPGAADAYSYVMMTDAELFDQSEGVARVVVERVLPVADGDHSTRYVLSVETVLAGPDLSPVELLVLPGTFDAPRHNRIIDGVPRLAPGGTFLLFYSRGSDGTLRPQQLTLGVFSREQTAQGIFYARYLEMSSDHAKDGFRRRYHAPRDPGAFESWLEARGMGAEREVDYLREEVSAFQKGKFTFSNFGFPVPGPGRWFQFDAGQTLNWTARPDGQADTNFDEFLSLQQALAAWTNDPGSKILMAYAGTAASRPSCDINIVNDPGCFSGHVVWNDPNNEIAGTYDCVSGTLAFGGSSATCSGQNCTGLTFNGENWYPRNSAFVLMQDGAGCFMDRNQGANGAQVLAHEVGHSIAFGHSCGDSISPACNTSEILNQALMRAFAHNDARGASLGVDDIAGAATVYPVPSVGPSLTPTPSSGTTTSMPTGVVGAIVTRSISFAVSGGSGAGTTGLSCSGSGDVTVASGTPQTIAVSGSVSDVEAQVTLGTASKSGAVSCTATPQNGSVQNFTFNFNALAGTLLCEGDCVFRDGFED